MRSSSACVTTDGRNAVRDARLHLQLCVEAVAVSVFQSLSIPSLTLTLAALAQMAETDWLTVRVCSLRMHQAVTLALQTYDALRVQCNSTLQASRRHSKLPSPRPNNPPHRLFKPTCATALRIPPPAVRRCIWEGGGGGWEAYVGMQVCEGD